MSVQVTKCPPGPINPDLTWEQQISRKYSYRTLLGAGFQHEEIKGVQDQSHGFRKSVPPLWALDDAKLRAVILTMERRHEANMNAGSSPSCKEWRTHYRHIRRVGGYRAFLVSIAYRSWRLGEDSVAVAVKLGIQPANVRQYLYRLRLTGEDLFPKHDEEKVEV